jgi:hypothetical protein
MPPVPFVIGAGHMPDLPDLDNPGSPNARNVIPRSSKSFGPYPSPQIYSSSTLTKLCQGAASFIDSGGNVYQFAGDANDLYGYSSSAWNKVSQTIGGYSCPSTGHWKFEYYNGQVFATDFDDAIQAFTLGSSTAFADLANGGVTALAVTGGSGYTNGINYPLTASGGGGTGFTGLVNVVGGALTNPRIITQGRSFASAPAISFSAGAGSGGSITATVANIAPTCRDMAMVLGFLVAVGTDDPNFGENPWRVWWSTAGNPAGWPTPGTAAAAEALSSYTDLTGPGGWNQGIAAGLLNANAIILQQHALWAMNFAGPPNVFDFTKIEGAKGCLAPGSIIVVSQTAFYLGEDGFYACDGTNIIPIGTDAVDHTFFADLDQNNVARVCAAVDVLNRMVMWAYPGKGNTNGNPNHILCYRWDIKRWSILDVTLEMLVRLLTTGYTLDQLYTILSYSIGDLPAPLDSTVWTGGAVNLGMFDTSNRLNYFNGPSLAATVDSGEREIFPGRRAVIGGECRPLVDSAGMAGSAPSLAIGRRNRLQDAVSFANAVAMNSLGYCPQRTTGRYVRARLTMPAGATWTNLWGANLDAVDGGGR